MVLFSYLSLTFLYLQLIWLSSFTNLSVHCKLMFILHSSRMGGLISISCDIYSKVSSALDMTHFFTWTKDGSSPSLDCTLKDKLTLSKMPNREPMHFPLYRIPSMQFKCLSYVPKKRVELTLAERSMKL